jgi:dolichol-phosphate mannosyltransferase
MQISSKYDLTVIIPTFNEENNIGEMIRAVDAVCKAHEINEDILVVDDNSGDNTQKIVTELKNSMPHLNLMVRYENHGLSQSLYDGINSAGSELVQCIDCDFSHPPDKIPVFYRYLKSRQYDMVIGSRYIPGGEVQNWAMSRRILSAGAALLGRVLIPHIRDSGSGFFAVRREIIEGVRLKPRGFRMGFEILGKGRWENATEIPITFKDREAGQSKMHWGIITEYLKQWGSIFYYNAVYPRSDNIRKSWKIFFHQVFSR